MTAYSQTQSTRTSNEGLVENVKKAIEILLESQISDTLILSSYKISTVIENRIGKQYKTEMVGRKLARIAKQLQLPRLSTRIPKYKLSKSNFDGF